MTTISIFRDGVWSGSGEITEDGEIIDCAAVLGPTQDESDMTYEMIADAIGHDPQDETGSIERPDGTYSWVIVSSES
jgi:hypothetical protein